VVKYGVVKDIQILHSATGELKLEAEPPDLPGIALFDASEQKTSSITVLCEVVICELHASLFFTNRSSWAEIRERANEVR
jgi:hypothetical protein